MGELIKANKLIERGLPESSIRQFCHMAGSPFFQKKPKGTWWCDTDKFDKWIDKLSEQKEVFR